MAGKDSKEIFKYYQQGIAKSDPEKYGTNGTISRLLNQQTRAKTTLPTFEEFTLQRAKTTQREALAERTRNRVSFYEQQIGHYPESDNFQSSSSTYTNRPTATQTRFPEHSRLQNTCTTSSASTQTNVHTPIRTVPLCQEQTTTWELVYKDNKGITWTRFKRNSQQEWLTGTILPNKNWEFSLSSETNDLFPA